jgi:AbrB family looped-hinge helix DNA binding protein
MLTSKGQTTIPAPVRDALNLKPGDKIIYELEGDRATLRRWHGAAALKGILAAKKGAGLSFAQIRAAAAASPKSRARASKMG